MVVGELVVGGVVVGEAVVGEVVVGEVVVGEAVVGSRVEGLSQYAFLWRNLHTAAPGLLLKAQFLHIWTVECGPEQLTDRCARHASGTYCVGAAVVGGRGTVGGGIVGDCVACVQTTDSSVGVNGPPRSDRVCQPCVATGHASRPG